MLEEEYQPAARAAPAPAQAARRPRAPFEFAIRDARAGRHARHARDLQLLRREHHGHVRRGRHDARASGRPSSPTSHKLGMPFLVAESPSGQLLGYALVAPWKQKRAYRFTVENSIYLGPAAAGKGLGRALLAELIDALEGGGHQGDHRGHRRPGRRGVDRAAREVRLPGDRPHGPGRLQVRPLARHGAAAEVAQVGGSRVTSSSGCRAPSARRLGG